MKLSDAQIRALRGIAAGNILLGVKCNGTGVGFRKNARRRSCDKLVELGFAVWSYRGGWEPTDAGLAKLGEIDSAVAKA